MHDLTVAVQRNADVLDYECVAVEAAYPDMANPRLRFRHPVRDLVRGCLADLGLDSGKIGTDRWNPLTDVVRPGCLVVVKPNLVRHVHRGGGDAMLLVTNPVVVECLLDFAVRAVGPNGRVVVGDAPLQSADWETLCRITGLPTVVEEYRRLGYRVELKDFRSRVVKMADVVVSEERRDQSEGCITVDVGRRSSLVPVEQHHRRFRVTDYDMRQMTGHHNEQRHEYAIQEDVLRCDLLLNVPKVKTHKKAGLTSAQKNLIGINCSKDYIPHHRRGPVRDGGDEYQHRSWSKAAASRLDEVQDEVRSVVARRALAGARHPVSRLASMASRDRYREGSWWGNDTLWRSIADLNAIAYQADSSGILGSEQQRVVLSVCDAVIVGEGEGPMEPEPLPAGMVLAGWNTLAVDTVVAEVLGMPSSSIPCLARTPQAYGYDARAFRDALSVSVNGRTDETLPAIGPARMPSGWTRVPEEG